MTKQPDTCYPQTYNTCLPIFEWNYSQTQKNYTAHSLELFMNRFSYRIVWLVRDNGCLLEKQETLKYLENHVLLFDSRDGAQHLRWSSF